MYRRSLVLSAGVHAFSLSGAATFSLRLVNSSDWMSYNGDMYPSVQSTLPPHLVHIDRDQRAEVVVHYTHDVRVSGDPGKRAPFGRWKLAINKERERVLWLQKGRKVLPDVVEGWFVGEVVGVEVRNLHHHRYVILDSAASDTKGVGRAAQASREFSADGVGPQIEIALDRTIRLASLQTRLVALRLIQSAPMSSKTQEIKFTLRTEDGRVFDAALPVRRVSHTAPFLSTFLSATLAPSHALYTAPRSPGRGRTIAALHGAGVDPASDSSRSFWTSSIPARPNGSWIVWPLGMTEWVRPLSFGLGRVIGPLTFGQQGYDWHGASHQDARKAVEHLDSVRDKWWPRATRSDVGREKPLDGRLVVVGHSNGGQGLSRLCLLSSGRVVGADFV